MDCREFDRSLSTPAGNRDDGWGRPWARSYPWYRAFVLALHATKDSLHLPRDPARIMDVFCATMILAMMRRIMDDSESNRRVFWPKVTKDGSSAIGSISFFYLPMMSIFEQWHNNSFALYFEVNHMYSKEHLSCYRKSLGIAECHDRIMSAMKLSPAYGSNDTLVEEVKGLIDRVELS